MKRILPLILAASMLLSLIPAVHAADAPASYETEIETDAADITEIDIADTAADVPTEEALPESPATEAPTELPTEAPTEPAAPAIPVITSVVPSANGVTVSWSSYPDTAKYTVFIRKADNSGWKIIGTTAATSFEHKLTADNTAYTYTVRACDSNGNFISGYDKTGYTFACLPAPTVSSIENVYGGQKLSWNTVSGAAAYKVFLRTDAGWKSLGVTEGSTFVNKNVVSGKKYRYTVRCWDPENRRSVSWFVSKTSSAYIASPEISSFTPISGGVRISWKAVTGAVQYGLFIRSGSKWKFLTITDKTSYDHKNLTAGTLYTYTLRCMAKNKSFTSGYNTVGVSFRYLANPAFTGITAADDGLLLSWDTSEYIAAYRVYRKGFNGAWECIGKSDTGSFTDVTAKSDTLYTYTLRGVDDNGTLITHFTDTGIYYYNKALADGKVTVGSSAVYFADGKVRQGYITVDGKMYYYSSKGVLQKNGLVGTAAEGFRYADKNGVIQLNYTGLATNSKGTWYVKNGSLYTATREAVTFNKVKYVIFGGKAYKVSTDEELTLYRAITLTNKVASRSLSKAKRLKIMFDYIKDAYEEYNPRLPDYTGMDWPIIYANDMLVDGGGNCLSYAAEFCFIAKAIGYDNVYACHSGGHGWSEIDGLVYDPEWSRHNFNYSYYALSYNTKTDQDYKGAIALGYAWMHIKICGHLK